MTLRQYLAIMTTATILCWTAWLFVIITVDPFQASRLSFFFFYISLFLALLGTTSLLIFGFYSRLGQAALPMFRHVERSFRDGCIAASLLVSFLYLQSRGWLNIINLLIFFLAMGCLLLFIFLNKKPKPGHNLTL